MRLLARLMALMVALSVIAPVIACAGAPLGPAQAANCCRANLCGTQGRATGGASSSNSNCCHHKSTARAIMSFLPSPRGSAPVQALNLARLSPAAALAPAAGSIRASGLLCAAGFPRPPSTALFILNSVLLI